MFFKDRNPSETGKIQTFINVINGVKKVPIDVLLKCEESLNVRKLT